jgi:hypothetical protein
MVATTASRNKWALLIGIDQYLRPYISQLRGCVNDVELMARILQDIFGFPAEKMTVLRDGQATREGILTALDRIADCAGEEDIVIIHYSGHGSQMTDREGDEPDGLDETIVPYDSGRSSDPNRDISDDEIYARLLRLTGKTPYVTLIFDCCHSGTITRDAFGVTSRWVEADTRPVEELPPSPVAPDVARKAGRDVGNSGWLPVSERYVLLAGCRDAESSYEHRVPHGDGDVTHGALTYFLSQELTQAEPGTTYRDVFERASACVTAAYPRQHPQMEGARDRMLFEVHDIQPTRFVPVRQRADGSVILAAGAAHGLTTGSHWAIYPQATSQVTEETARLGLVEIAAVGAVTSRARILEESGQSAITAGARAVEEAHFYGEMCLTVDLHAAAGYEAAARELKNGIEASRLLRWAAGGRVADARAYLVAPRSRVGAGDPVPQLGTLAKATWAVVGQDGRLIMPLHGVGESNATEFVCDNLEKAARYRQALALSNPNAHSVLKGKVGFTLKRQDRDGAWVKVEPEVDGGLPVFFEGERIAAEITNNHTAPVYVSVLDFGLTGALGLLHPVAGASEELAPGRCIEFGVRHGDEVTLYLPDNFPYIPDPSDEAPVGGTEIFKLLATVHKADFGLLLQPGYRAIEQPTPLGRLLGMALTGHGRRDAQRNRLPLDEEWTTLERPFFLQR